MKNKVTLTFGFLVFTLFSFAQSNQNNFNWGNSIDNIVMTWIGTTPEQEMNDDIKALADHGVTIKYSNVKRNEKREITAIDVSFEDKNGNKGTLGYKNNKPIPTIKFFKQGEEIGFGEPSSQSSLEDIFSFGDVQNDKLQQFNFNFDTDSLATKKFEFKSPNGNPFITTKKKIVYKKDGRKPLVIMDGEVVEGGDEYSQEEIDRIKQESSSKEENEISVFSDFNFNDKKSLSDQMKKMQEQINKLLEKNGLSDDKNPKQPGQEPEKAKSTPKMKKA